MYKLFLIQTPSGRIYEEYSLSYADAVRFAPPGSAVREIAV